MGIRLICLPLFAILLLSCRSRGPAGPLTPTGRQTITVSWTLQPMSALAVNVRQLSSPYGSTVWSTNVTGANSVSLPHKPNRSTYFTASVSSELMKLGWSYSGTLNQNLTFNLYSRPFETERWMVLTNFPGTNLLGQVWMSASKGQFTLTASNRTERTESAAADPVTWTNRVGLEVPVEVTIR